MVRGSAGAFVLLVTMVACGASVEQGAGGGGSAAAGGGAGGAPGAGGSGGSTGTGVAGASACGSPASRACSGAGECVLASPSCCLCGLPEIEDFVAVTLEHAADCVCEGPACGCATQTNANLAATCDAGACRGWDVRKEDAYSACKAKEDCRLRAGLACCQPCQADPFSVVAVRADVESALREALCAPDEACSKCLPGFPPDASAECVDGHCAVVLVN